MARNKKINALIAISIGLAVIGINFGTNKNRQGDVEWKNFLMENGPYGASGTLNSEEATRVFAQSCNHVTPAIYKQLASSTLNYTYRSDKGDTLWHLCQKSMVWPSVVEKLRAADVSMETANKEGRTPWLAAVAADNVVAAKWFKEHGANTSVVDAAGNPAWFLAAGSATHDALRLWGLEKTEERNAYGQNDLMYALANNREERAKKLFDMGPDLGMRDRNGKVALHYAASSGNEELTLAIIQRNPEYLYIEDTKRKKPQDVASGRARSILREYTGASSRYD